MFGKKKKEAIEANINTALSVCSKISEEDMVNKFYVDEKGKLVSLLIVLTQSVYKTEKQVFTENQFNKILEVYYEIWKVLHSSFENKKYLAQYLNENIFGKIECTPEFTQKELSMSILIFMEYIRGTDKNLSPETFIRDKSDVSKKNINLDMDKIEKFADSIEKIDEDNAIIAEFNKKIEEEGKSKDNYGIDSHNPVFVNGYSSLSKYLNHLYDANGNKLKFMKVSNMTVVEVAGNIEAYRAYYLDNETEVDSGIIFICACGNNENTCPPVGYVYK